MTWQTHVALAAVFAAMMELVLHWFPWRLVLRRDLPRVAAYVLGVLAFAAPFSLLLLLWKIDISPEFPLPQSVLLPASALVHRVLVGFWACVIGSGAAVALAYGLDHLADAYTNRAELQEIMDGQPAE